MNNKKPIKYAFITGLVTFLSVLASINVLYKYSLHIVQEDIEDYLKQVVYNVAFNLNKEIHKSFTDREQEYNEPYLSEIAKMRLVKSMFHDVKYVYTCIKINKKIYFVLDPTEPDYFENDVESKSHIMQEYEEAANIPGLMQAFRYRKLTFTSEPYKDQWGSFVSAYMPLFTKNGEFVGVAAVDITAVDYIDKIARIKSAALFSSFIGFLISIIVACLNYWHQKSNHNIELELLKSEERFKLVLEGANDGIWDWFDVTKDEKYWSPQFIKLLGYEENEIKPTYSNFKKMIHPDDIASAMKAVADNFYDHVPYSVELRLKKKSGEYCWFKAKAITVRNEKGNPKRMVGSIRDISQRKEAQRAIMESEAKIRAILENSVDGILTIDGKGNILSFNPAAEKIFGFKETEILGKSINNLMPENERYRHDAYLRQHDRSGFSRVLGMGREINAIRNDGSAIPLWIGISKIKLPDGGYIFGAIIHDLTATKLAEKQLLDYTKQLEEKSIELLKAKEHAETLSKLKSEFLANISHEIRTPMNGIVGMSNLLLETKLNPAQVDYARIIVSSADSLLLLVNDILDFSKIEAGKLQLETTSFNIHQQVSDVIKLLAVKAKEKNLEIILDYNTSNTKFVKGDPLRLRQILFNIIGNAIKFTENGHVKISVIEVTGNQAPVNTSESNSHPIFFKFKIEDTGIGIDSSKIELIFQKFTQSDSSTTRKYGGTGLGLSISKELVNLMHGDLAVTSELGVGSCFEFTLKFLSDDEIAGNNFNRNKNVSNSTEQLKTKIHGKKILVVEDNIVNQIVITQILEKLGCIVDITAIGNQAIELFRNNNYAIIFMDIQMSDTSGLELINHFIELEHKQNLKHTPIIAFTASDKDELNFGSTALKVDDFLTKPIKPFEVERILDKHI